MSQTNLRAAVIGVGYLGKFHAQKYKGLEGVTLEYVCDVNPAQAEKVAQELGVRALTNFKDLKGQVDLVTIAASTASHFEISKWCLEQGIHVFVEKPMTTTSQEAEELCRIARARKLKLQVGHVVRFTPAMVSARQVVSHPLFIEVHRLAPFTPRGADVDVVLDLMIHDIDVILNLVQSPVKDVQAVGVPVITKLVDIANARLEFQSGTVVNMTASRVSLQTMRKFRVFEPDKYLSIDFVQGTINCTTKVGEWKADGEPPIQHESWSLEKGDPLFEEVKSFVTCVRNDSEPLVPGEDGLLSLKVAEQILGKIKERPWPAS